MQNVQRHPSGQVVREEPRQVAWAQRTKSLLTDIAFSQYFGYELGRMFLARQIDQRHVDAGKRWHDNRAMLIRIEGLKMPHKAATNWEPIPGYDSGYFSEANKDMLKLLRKYFNGADGKGDGADFEIGRCGGARAHRLMESVVLNNKRCEDYDVPLLKRILGTLAAMSNGRKAA